MDLIDALENSRATGYRYIKTLQDAGLLTTFGNGNYSLGPRIIEMDLQIRLADPLLLAGQGVLEELADQIGHSAILHTAFDDVSVLCVGECRAPLSPPNRISRGQRHPLFQGTGSMVILARLPRHRLQAIFASQPKEIENAGLGSTWSDFRKILTGIKRDGYHVARGGFHPGADGVAAPIVIDDKEALGSVGVAWDEKNWRDVDVQHAILAVRQAARVVSERLMGTKRPSAPEHRQPGGS